MTVLSEIGEGLVCCRCSVGTLTVAQRGWRCRECGVAYPLLGGLPCLMPDPATFQIGWRARLAAYGAMVEASVRGIAAQRERQDLPGRTRARLTRVAEAFLAQRRTVETLMAPVVVVPSALAQPALPARSDAEAGLSLLHHYENVFRDWAWGDEELDRQRTLIQRISPAGPTKRLALYGAGAGRLAADLHHHLAPVCTIAIDTNPLPLTIARQLTAGHTVDLPEFPVAPRGDAQVVVSHRLRAGASRPGLTFMFADALTPPFASESLDVVVTPWFIDVAGVDLPVTAAAVNRVLRPGGVWLNIGPLMFKGDIAAQYPIEEVLDIVSGSGFALASEGSEEVPYFRSPHSGSSRTERLFWYAATKTGHAHAIPRPALQPPWLTDTRVAVPVIPALTKLQQSSVFTAAVLSMVDGATSIEAIAARTAGAWNTVPDAAADHLRTFFGSFFGDPGTR